ncbi:MAG: hypothetical protein Q8917_19175, partial [Bacillota bacterium]|nr:hypothetical protein [Bacillota bacterium]
SLLTQLTVRNYSIGISQEKAFKKRHYNWTVESKHKHLYLSKIIKFIFNESYNPAAARILMICLTKNMGEF